MINLLSPQAKRDIRAARVNVVLLRHCMMLGGTALLVPVVFGAGMWLTWQGRVAAEARKAASEQVAANYAQTRRTAESFAQDLQQAKTILGNGVSFYTLLTQIAAVVPQGVILSNLSLGTASPDAPITISARARGYTEALQLKNNLAQSAIFASVNVTNANTGDGNDEVKARYPVDVTLSATFKKDFLTGAKP